MRNFISRAGGVLDLAGRNGPMLLLCGVMVGILLPPVAWAARPFMGLAVFLFTLGAFLKVDPANLREELARPLRALAVMAWVGLGVPACVLVLVAIMAPPEGLGDGMILVAAAPPVGSAAAIAAMLGLNTALALLTSFVATVASPVTLPALAAQFAGVELSIDPVAMARNLLLIVGGAGLATWLLRRYAAQALATSPRAMTGVAVVGLLIVGLGAMDGMQARLLADPVHVGRVLLLAFTINVGLQVIGTILFASLGGSAALSVGLVSGNRNVTLAWAAAGQSLLPETELFLAMSVIPIFVLPALTRRLVRDPALLFRRFARGTT